MFLWLFLLSNGLSSDTTVVDSTPVRRYAIPEIICFGTTGILDSALNQIRVIEPDIFLSGFSDIFQNSPYLLRENGYIVDLLSLYPYRILINSHYLEQYFFKGFNFTFFPYNFVKSVVFVKKYVNSGVNSINLNTKFNNYDQPYSYLYFTLFGPNTIYNMDFTRALTNSAGFYLGGFYSRHYKNSTHLYLRTNAGYANFYYNQFLPMRLDIVVASSSYDTITNLDFSDITLTAGKDFYRFIFFRTASKLSNIERENQFLTYGTQHKFLFYSGNFENLFEIDALTSQFAPGEYKNNEIDFSQNTNYKFNKIIAGIGFRIDYGSDKIYFEPETGLNFEILNDAKIFVRFGLFNRKPDFIAHYGNYEFVDRDLIIKGNPDIEAESYFHREIGVAFGNSLINLYNANIKNQIIYQTIVNDSCSAVNVDNEITGIEGILVSPVIKGFSLTGAYNYQISNDFPSAVPDFFINFILNWQRKTERSVMNVYTRFRYLNARYSPSGKYYEPFFTISPGLSLKFLTLHLGLIFDNVTDTKPEDFPEIVRNFGMEIKWEFWD
uniref:TonB-dependent receptor n=1 Tax=candidate division WOR-3 bacterium TaxID=2052148 RepID=A0A7V0Z4R0_UNCW3